MTRAATAERILMAALREADDQGWEAVTLHALARRLRISLREIHACYRDKDAIANAWFGRALDAMLAAKIDPRAPVEARLGQALIAWQKALAPYRAVTRQMLLAKMHPPHPHHWVPMLFDLSRTVQWWREVAGCGETGIRRAAAEAAATGVFLAVLAAWLADATPEGGNAEALRVRLLAAYARVFP